jgi:lysine 2,3-aminomutase
MSYWTKNYRTSVEAEDELALSREYPYYDPIHTLPERGQTWWRDQAAQPAGREAQPAAAG